MSSELWEGVGGPVRMDEANLNGIDPTLDACCRREIESNRKRSALEKTLSRHDVVAMTERRRRHLVSNLTWGVGCRCCYDPNSDGGEYRALIEAREILQKEKQDEEEPEEEQKEDEDESDDEFDYLLEEDYLTDDDGGVIHELEERRRAELEFAILHQEVALQHGYGAHRQMHPGRVLRAAGLAGGGAPSPAAVVLHLVDPDSMASASLDLLLEVLAEKYRGTKFLRSGGRSVLLVDSEMAQKVLPRLRPDSDMPALVAIREGVVISVCPRLQGLVDEDQVIPGEVRTWLDNAGVLQDRPPPFDELCRVRPEEEALYDHMAAAQENAPPRYDCGIPTCEKTFAHQHVGVQTKQQDGLVIPEEEVVGGVDD